MYLTTSKFEKKTTKIVQMVQLVYFSCKNENIKKNIIIIKMEDGIKMEIVIEGKFGKKCVVLI